MVPGGKRVYAIGDIHAQCELLLNLVRAIEVDNQERGAATLQLVFLGDYIDRGANSAQLLRILAEAARMDNIVFLKGNHEQLLLDVYGGVIDAAMIWPKIGGTATLSSFGVSLDKLDASDPIDVIEATQKFVPQHVIDWIASLPVSYQIGDYYFVHAGIRPGTPLGEQVERDQLWIREEFTTSNRFHGAMIVHGHTVTASGPVFADNRIGIDTGAYKSGRLTALGLEGEERWIIQAHDSSLTSNALHPAGGA